MIDKAVKLITTELGLAAQKIKNVNFIYGIKKLKLIEGEYSLDNKKGVWKYFYPVNNILVKSTYSNNKLTDEVFLIMDSLLPFSGTFSKITENDNSEEIKIKNGQRNGNTKIIDNNGNVISKIKYKKGIKID